MLTEGEVPPRINWAPQSGVFLLGIKKAFVLGKGRRRQYSLVVKAVLTVVLLYLWWSFYDLVYFCFYWQNEPKWQFRFLTFIIGISSPTSKVPKIKAFMPKEHLRTNPENFFEVGMSSTIWVTLTTGYNMATLAFWASHAKCGMNGSTPETVMTTKAWTFEKNTIAILAKSQDLVEHCVSLRTAFRG